MIRVNGSGQGASVITPSDTDNISFPSGTPYTLNVYVGVTGNLAAVMANGQVVLYENIPVGFHDLSVVRINSTNTTATKLVAIY
jgi:hypothetical protein